MGNSFRNQRVVVTGGCGFIGSHLVKRLIREGARVIVISRNSARCIRIIGTPVVLEQASLTNRERIAALVKKHKPHFVFHLAAYESHERDFALFAPCFDVHVEGTRNLVEPLLRSADFIRFIHVGTIEEYGRGKAPFQESDREYPVSPYSATKLMATKFVEYCAREEEFPAVIIRPALIYGPGQVRGMFIPDLIRACMQKRDFRMTAGTQTRDFLYVDDLIDSFFSAALRLGLEGEIINVGSGKEMQLRHVAVFVNRLMGSPIKIRFGALPFRRGEMRHFWLDVKKAKKLLQWTPRVNLKAGISTTVDWYRENP